MRKLNICAALVAIVAATAVAGPFAVAAPSLVAAQGVVAVFSTEVTELAVFENPNGCHGLPAAAHVLLNQTDSPVTIYGDPLCLSPGLVVQPGYGSHVAAGSGSFSV